jgi:hypothetical protein
VGSKNQIPLTEIVGIEIHSNMIWRIFWDCHLIIHTNTGNTGGSMSLFYVKNGRKFRRILGELTGK